MRGNGIANHISVTCNLFDLQKWSVVVVVAAAAAAHACHLIGLVNASCG
jgi:hypothetical protein